MNIEEYKYISHLMTCGYTPKMNWSFLKNASEAQLVKRSPCKGMAAGSSPVSGSQKWQHGVVDG